MELFNDFYAAFDNHLMSLDSDVTKENRIIFPNVSVDEPSGDYEYLRPILIPSDTDQVCLGVDGMDRTEGIYQIEVMTPNLSGRSCNIDLIARLFRRGTVIKYNDVKAQVMAVSIAAGLKERVHYITPISIRWQAFTPARQ